MCVRAQFSYDPAEDATLPCLGAALSFRRGDILEVVARDDDVWWQARREDTASGSSRVGLIPSRLMQQRCVHSADCLCRTHVARFTKYLTIYPVA